MYPFSNSRSSKTTFPILTEASEHFTTPDAGGSIRPSTLESILSFLFKRSARHLRAHLAVKHGLDLTHGQSLDAVSAGLGCTDWNTANAQLQQLARDDQGGLGLANAQAAAAAQLQGPWHQGHLRGRLDFNVSSAIVGAAGSGKSVGMLFALQARHDVAVGRPVMVIHGYESERYQPNWSGWLRYLPRVRAWSTDVANAKPEASDIVEVEAMAPANVGHGLAADADNRRQTLTAQLLKWLADRAHLRPLLLVDEAYPLFGKHTGEFIAALPAEVVVVWVTQTVEDLWLPALSQRFDVVHLLSAPRGPRAWNALGFTTAQERQRLEQRMIGLPMGEAVTIPLDTSGRAVTRGSADDVKGREVSLRARVLSAIEMSLSQLQVQRELSPTHILPVGAWQVGKRMYVLEAKLRDKVWDHLPPEDQAVVARMRRPGAPVSGLALLLLEVLEGAGWLVRQVGDTTLAPTEALWNVKVGKLTYKGVVLFEIPGTVEPPSVGLNAAVPAVTGPLFAEPSEAGKRLRSILRAPMR